MKIFCVTCQIPICRDCKDFAPSHAGHPTNLIANVMGNNRALLDQAVSKMRQVGQGYLAELAYSLDAEASLERNVAATKQALDREMAALIEKVKAQKAALDSQVDQFHAASKATIRKHRQELLVAYSNVAVTQEECTRVSTLPGVDLLGQLKGTLSHSIAAASQHPRGVPPTVSSGSITLDPVDANVAMFGRLSQTPASVTEAKVVEAKLDPNTVLSPSGFPVPKRPVKTTAKTTAAPPANAAPPAMPPSMPPSSPPSMHSPPASATSPPAAVPPALPHTTRKDAKLRALAATTDPNLLSLNSQLEYLRKGSHV